MARAMFPEISFVVTENSGRESPSRSPDKTVWYCSCPRMISCWSNATACAFRVVGHPIKVPKIRTLKKMLMLIFGFFG